MNRIRITVAILLIHVLAFAHSGGGSGCCGIRGYVLIPNNDSSDKKILVDRDTLLLGVKALILKTILLTQLLNSQSSTTTMMIPVDTTTVSTTTTDGTFG